MYTEYVFDSKKIDVALCQIKAAIFDIVSEEQEKIASVREKANNMQDDDIKEILGRLCVEQEECVQRLMSFSNELAKILKKLDSYSRELKRVEDKNNAIIVDDLSRKVELAEQLLSTQPQIRELVQAASNGENIEELIAKMGQSSVAEQPQMVQTEEPQMVQPEEPQMVQTEEPQKEPEKPKKKSKESKKTEEPVAESSEEKPAESEEKKDDQVIMPYDDEVSTLKDLPPLTPLNYDNAVTPGDVGQQKDDRVIIPYNDDISTIEITKDAPAEGETVKEDTPSEAAPSEGEAPKDDRVIIPYNDDISTIEITKDAPTEGEAATEENSSEAAPSEGETPKDDRVIIPYDDNISTIEITKDTPAEGEAAKEETSSEAAPSEGEVPKEGEASSEPVVAETENKDTTEILTTDETATAAAPSVQETESVLPEVTTEAVVFTEPVVDSMKNNGPIPVIVPSTPAIESTEQSADSNKMVFQKKSADAAKVILTTATQTSKLRNSLATQEALLSAKGFFQKNESDMTQKENEIQDMMNQANQLYNDGKVDEAQKMYDDISAMSKTLKPNESVGIAA